MQIENGTVAVITGGASGIGYGLAEAVAERGGRVVVADIREDGVEAAVRQLRSSGTEAIGEVFDVGDAEAVRAVAERTWDTFGRIDLVCNNAGVITPGAPLWEQSDIAWDRMITVKLRGVINGVTAFAPYLLRQGAGHFLNTASSAGLTTLSGRTPYTTVMHAVVGLTETLDLELKEHAPGLGATVLCPGRVDTPLGANSAALGATALPTASAMVQASAADIVTPREVAESAIAGIEAGVVHVAPGPGVAKRARDRVERLLDDLAIVSD